MPNGAVVVIGICVVGAIILIALRKKLGLDKPISPGVATAGVVIACIIASGIVYSVVMKPPKAAPPPVGMDGGPMGGGMGGGAMMGGGGPGGGGGMMGGGAGGPGGGPPPAPGRELRSLVRRIAEFSKTPDALSPETTAAVLPVLVPLLEPEVLSDEAAEAADKALRAAFTEEQLAAIEAVELPRGGWGGGGGGGGRPAPAEGGAPGGNGEQTDRRQAFVDRMLAIPSVKAAYDEKVAADPAFAEDAEQQQEFFRSAMRNVNPFFTGSTRETLEELIARLKGEAPPAP